MARESLEEKKHRAADIIAALKKRYPDVKCALNHSNAYELLVATILSAQCTDVRVNMVTPVLFKKYPAPEALANASQVDVETIIRTTGFFRSKAKSIRESAADIVLKHGGKVPQNMHELTALRGVGRKTANVVLGNAFNQNVGVVVDTHVNRLSNRLALTTHKDPAKIEQDLMKLIPQPQWTLFSHLLIHHGRQICTARNPKCNSCPILNTCPTGPKLIAAANSLASHRKAPNARASHGGA
ncbi:MAG: endonuclease III [Phycisphaerales bacterium]|nr:endonuclease III [Phycisphaerales bacterium]